MQQYIAILLLAFIATAYCAHTHHAILPYVGTCERNGQTLTCDAKGQGAEFKTFIDATGNVHFEAHPLHGAISHFNSTGTVTTNGQITEHGEITFGIHQTHKRHALLFKATGIINGVDGLVAMSGQVTGGRGAWEGATGVLSYSVSYTERNGGKEEFVGAFTFFVQA